MHENDFWSMTERIIIMDIKKILKYLASAALAALLLWVSFREVEWSDFLAGLKECRWGYVLLSMAAGSFAFWLRGLRWRRLLLPIDDRQKSNQQCHWNNFLDN